MVFKKEQMQKSLKQWKKNKTTQNLSMTLGGTIHVVDNQEIVNKKLQRLAGKQSLDASGETLPETTTPVAEDFVDVEFRALSVGLLHDRPVDFSDAAMLKRSTNLLLNQTIYKDHNTFVDNWVGKVTAVSWDEETKGFPPGINANLRLDSIKDPMAVRGVLQGALHSSSVTVSFQWKPSHEALMENGTFFEHLGETIDDELVRVVVTKIEKFWEISLVWQGADEYAKQIDEDGNPVGTSASLSLKTLTNTKEDTMNELLKILKELFGTDVTEENAKELLAKAVDAGKVELSEGFNKTVKELQESFTKERKDMSDKLTKVLEEVETLKKEKEELAKQAKVGEVYLSHLKDETERLYKLLKGKEASQLIIDTFKKSEVEVLKAFKETFEAEVKEKFPHKCASCGSKNINRQSSITPDLEKDDVKSNRLSDDETKRLKDLNG